MYRCRVMHATMGRHSPSHMDRSGLLCSARTDGVGHCSRDLCRDARRNPEGFHTPVHRESHWPGCRGGSPIQTRIGTCVCQSVHREDNHHYGKPERKKLRNGRAMGMQYWNDPRRGNRSPGRNCGRMADCVHRPSHNSMAQLDCTASAVRLCHNDTWEGGRPHMPQLTDIAPSIDALRREEQDAFTWRLLLSDKAGIAADGRAGCTGVHNPVPARSRNHSNGHQARDQSWEWFPCRRNRYKLRASPQQRRPVCTLDSPIVTLEPRWSLLQGCIPASHLLPDPLCGGGQLKSTCHWISAWPVAYP